MNFAQKDIERIYKFCLKISKMYAQRIIKEIFSSFYNLKIFPKMYPKFEGGSYNNIRYIPLKRYIIIYKIYKNKIFIQRIFDVRQNPKKIKIN